MTDSLAKRLMGDLLAGTASPVPELVMERGPAVGQRLPLPPVGARIVIGRGDDAGWVVRDRDLSRAHAAVEHRADGAWICDLGSKNGTKVDGVRAPQVPPGLRLTDGALVTLGGTALRVCDPAHPGAHGVIVSATRTHDPAPLPAVPPRWPIAAAAIVALAALAVLLVLLLG